MGRMKLIGLLCHALLATGDHVILPQPSFLIYEIMTRSVGAVPVSVPLKALSIDLDGVYRSRNVRYPDGIYQ